jgi:hypothetical protein
MMVGRQGESIGNWDEGGKAEGRKVGRDGWKAG